MPEFDQPTLDLLDERAEVDMLTPRRDGSMSGWPIGSLWWRDAGTCARCRGPRGIWYKRALENGGAVIEVNGQTMRSASSQCTDEELNRRISDAFQDKYPSSGATPTRSLQKWWQPLCG